MMLSLGWFLLGLMFGVGVLEAIYAVRRRQIATRERLTSRTFIQTVTGIVVGFLVVLLFLWLPVSLFAKLRPDPVAWMPLGVFFGLLLAAYKERFTHGFMKRR